MMKNNFKLSILATLILVAGVISGCETSGSSAIANSDIQLGNRKALNRPRPLHNCEAEGTVVVRIWVDKKGVVQKAEVAVSGTTNSNSCLIESAQGAALKTQFEADPDAPNLQVGFVRFGFINQ